MQRLRLVRPLVACAVGLLGADVLRAQTAAPLDPNTADVRPTVVAQIKSLDRAQAELERHRERNKDQPAAFADQYLQDSAEGLAAQLAQDAQDAEAESRPPTGQRSWELESRAQATHYSNDGDSNSNGNNNGTSRTQEAGLLLKLSWETQDHGIWQLQAQASHRARNVYSLVDGSEPARGQRVLLRNLAFPITPFVFADTSVGDIGSEVTDGLTRGQRFSLGTSAVRGVGLHVYGPSFDLRAGVGERSSTTGSPYETYQTTQGDLLWAGYTQRLSNTWLGGGNFWAIGLTQARDTRWVGPDTRSASSGASELPPLNATTTGLALSAGHGHLLLRDGDTRLRLTALASRTTFSDAQVPVVQPTGLIFEGGWQSGTTRHEAGLYQTDAELRHGDQFVGNGSRGLYWRMNQNLTRVDWGMALDLEQQNANEASTGGAGRSRWVGASGNWSHRLSQRSSWGGHLSLTEQTSGQPEGGGSRSGYGGLYYQQRWFDTGDTRLRLTVRRQQNLVSNGERATGEEFEWEQDWQRAHFETQQHYLRTLLGYARDRSATDTQTYPTAGLSWHTALGTQGSVSGGLRYSSRRGQLSTSQGLSGSLQMEWRIANGWTLGGTLGLNQARVSTHAVGAGLGAQPGVRVSRSHEKTASLYLRYEGLAGTPYGTTGVRGAQGAGTGRIEGVVYMDANQDGVQQPDEPGLPRVEVVLNGRFSAETDARGRFTFNPVPTGVQRIALNPDSIPLPWGESPGSRTTVQVPLRDVVQLALPTTRLGDASGAP